MTSSRGQLSEIRVKSRKSQIMMAAHTLSRFRAWWRRPE